LKLGVFHEQTGVLEYEESQVIKGSEYSLSGGEDGVDG
jgi:hypothetical protein